MTSFAAGAATSEAWTHGICELLPDTSPSFLH
jgi:hypothetical protein